MGLHISCVFIKSCIQLVEIVPGGSCSNCQFDASPRAPCVVAFSRGEAEEGRQAMGEATKMAGGGR
jgi:hypothetical protein